MLAGAVVTPINQGILQTPLNGGGQSITNVSSVMLANGTVLSGGGLSGAQSNVLALALTNLPAGVLTNGATNVFLSDGAGGLYFTPANGLVQSNAVGLVQIKNGTVTAGQMSMDYGLITSDGYGSLTAGSFNGTFNGLGQLALSNSINAGNIVGTIPASQVAGLGLLALSNNINAGNIVGTIPASQVAGLGLLALSNNINAGNIAGTIPVSQVSGLGQLALSNSINAGNIVGTIPASQISGIVTNLLPQNVDVLNAIQDINLLGQLPYLSDFALFQPQYNTNLTYAGQSIIYSNVTWSVDGAVLATNSGIYFPVAAGASNTVLIVLSYPASFVSSYTHSIINLCNTNTHDAEFVTTSSGGWQSCFLQTNNVPYPSVVNFTNLLNDGWLGYTWQAYPNSRMRMALSTDGKGVVTFYVEGRQVGFYNSGGNSLTNAFYPAAMNWLEIGLPWRGTNTINRLGIGATVESVWVFNKLADTNLLLSMQFASDWTQRKTKKRIYVGDSKMAGNSTGTNFATAIQQAEPDTIYQPYFRGGAGIANPYTTTTGLTNSWWLWNQPHGKVSNTMLVQLGINDNPSAALFLNYSNAFLAQIYNKPGWKMTWCLVPPPSTNSIAHADVGGARSDRIAFNNAIMGARDKCVPVNLDALTPLSLFNTNRIPRISIEGLHANDPTNGDAWYRMCAGEVLASEGNGYNPWKMVITPEPLPFPATGATWTNNVNQTIQITIDNTGVTATGLSKNGVTIVATPTGSISFPLNAGDWFSETYSAGAPTATYSLLK